jgi:NADH pyrophosphatase NudC (nudix superfamily)
MLSSEGRFRPDTVGSVLLLHSTAAKGIGVAISEFGSLAWPAGRCPEAVDAEQLTIVTTAGDRTAASSAETVLEPDGPSRFCGRCG